MKGMAKLIAFAVIGFIILALPVASVYADEQTKYSGFLENYPPFRPGPSGGVNLVYIKEGVDFSKYSKVMFDHVVFYLKNDAAYKGIQAEDMKELADAFHHSAIKALEGAYPLVAEPGPDVLRVRVAITDIEPSNPAKSAVTTVMPVGLALSFLKKGVTGKHTGVGSAGIEAEFLDSLTNERLAAAVDKREGSKISGLSKFGAANEAFDFWSGRLRTFLDDAHKGKQ